MGGFFSVISEWWSDVDGNKAWQDRIFEVLGLAYGIIGAIAAVQLVRIQLRVPEYGWTTQKVFHLLNCVVNFVRAVVFYSRRSVQGVHPKVLSAVLLDLPGLLFFTTYTLLVLFWAEIYHQARSLPTENLRPTYLVVNAAIYVLQGSIWFAMLLMPDSFEQINNISKFFFAGVSFAAAFGFVLYGYRLYRMLKNFPIESKGRRKKLREVGWVTAICFTCFTVRAFLIAYSGVDKVADLDVMNHPILNLIYYTLVEIVPSALVLYILRKLPPKKAGAGYHAIR